MNDKREEFKLVFLLENFFRDGNNWYVVWWSSTLVGVVANLKSLKVRPPSQQQPFAYLLEQIWIDRGTIVRWTASFSQLYPSAAVGRLLEKRRRSSNGYTMGPKDGRRTAVLRTFVPLSAAIVGPQNDLDCTCKRHSILCANAPGTICHFMSHMSQQFEGNNPIDYGTAYLLQIRRKLCST